VFCLGVVVMSRCVACSDEFVFILLLYSCRVCFVGL
jgi:hypothetical protein